VLANQSLESVENELALLRKPLFFAGWVALLLAGLGGWLLARKSLAPVVAMAGSARRIGAENLGQQLPVADSRDELGQLATTFNELLARLHAAFEQQRRFMADASHELRTPLSVMRTAAGVTLRKRRRGEDEYREAIQMMDEQTQRLSRIVKDMFILARADAGRYPLDKRSLYLNDLLEEVARAGGLLAADKNVTLEITNSSEAGFHGDEDLLRQMTLNLVDNAIRRTPPGGGVQLSLTQESTNYVISVSDTGPGIPFEAQARIFERFYRADKARSRSEDDNGDGAGLGLALLCGNALLISSCSSSGKAGEPSGKNASEQETPVTVAVAKVGREDLSQQLALAAEFRPYREIDLHAKVAGYLKDIRVEVGDRVRQGQLIATLEIPEFHNDLNQAAASRKRSESEVVRARSEVQRAQSVLDAAKLIYSRLAAVSRSRPNLLAQQEVDDALAKAQIAEAQLNTARAGLAVAEEQVRVQEASEARAKTMADYTAIIAPFSGLITKRYADKGAMIQAGTASQTQAMPVVRLSQVDHLRLILPIPESVVPGIRVGRAVKIKAPALDQTFDGRVARFSGKVDSATRTMETEVDVANPGLILKPGMYAYADLALELKTATLTVPVQAVSRKDNKASVMVVNAQNRLEHREVSTGLESPISVEIVSGLAENELVVVGNQGQLKPGQAVRLKEMALSGSKGGH